MSQRYHVWECLVNGRVSYRATEVDPNEAPDAKPPWATAHLDTVEASGKRQAITKAVRAYKNYR